MRTSGVLPLEYQFRNGGAMAPFGFTPNEGENSENGDRENLEAMMRAMQEQIQKQFEGLGLTGGMAGFAPGFAPGFGSQQVETLPLATVRDTAK